MHPIYCPVHAIVGQESTTASTGANANASTKVDIGSGRSQSISE